MKSLRAFALCLTTSLVLVVPGVASAQAPGSDKSGGAAYQEPVPTPTPAPAPADITVPGAVAQLLPDGSAAVSYTESTEGQSQVKLRRVEQSGARSPAVSVARVTGAEYPRLAHAPGELLVTWSEIENGYSHVRTARAVLPSR